MSFLPIFLFAFVVILVAVMPWHRPHPNHSFFVGLLQNYLKDGSDRYYRKKLTPHGHRRTTLSILR